MDIIGTIEKKIGEVHVNSLDLSLGEIISLYTSGELIISPDFQRYFRWSVEKRSRLIESILLKLPIPQIFLMENPDGVLELIDGLQRVSSVIQFIQPELINKTALTLKGCDLLEELNFLTFDQLPTTLRLNFKRTPVRAVVIGRQSSTSLRYAMFKRLNTGGEELSEQEVRNCTARMAGPDGVAFYDFLIECAEYPAFKTCTLTLPEELRDRRGDEELVLRFLALKNARDLFKGSVTDWLDNYQEKVVFKYQPMPIPEERAAFNRLFNYLSKVMGEDAFVRFRGQKAIGALAPAYYEAMTLGFFNRLDQIQGLEKPRVRDKIIALVQEDRFRRNVGSGSNSLQKFDGRIAAVEEALSELLA
jgi:hypothetical protein